MGKAPPWTLAEQQTTIDHYFDKRNRKDGLRLPALFLILALAERYRSGGAVDDARRLLSFAVDNLPGSPVIRTLRDEFDPNIPINSDMLIPSSS